MLSSVQRKCIRKYLGCFHIPSRKRAIGLGVGVTASPAMQTACSGQLGKWEPSHKLRKTPLAERCAEASYSRGENIKEDLSETFRCKGDVCAGSALDPGRKL
jgi:hypothetical protein